MALERWKNGRNIPEFSFRPVTTEETKKLIAKLGSSTSYGHDMVDAASLKVAAKHLTEPIRHLINSSLKSGKYAARWKIAKTTPLLKDKEP